MRERFHLSNESNTTGLSTMMNRHAVRSVERPSNSQGTFPFGPIRRRRAGRLRRTVYSFHLSYCRILGTDRGSAISTSKGYLNVRRKQSRIQEIYLDVIILLLFYRQLNTRSSASLFNTN